MTDRIIKVLGSMKLTVVCLGLGMLLVLFGTLAQVHDGLYAVQSKYFESWLVWWGLHGTPFRIPVFPGGNLVGGVLVINLLASMVQRMRTQGVKLGFCLTHGGLLILVLGQFVTQKFQVETYARLETGTPLNYSESRRENELAVIETTGKEFDQVVAIPEAMLKSGQELKHADMPFRLRVREYHVNAQLAERKGDDSTPPAASQGVGKQAVLTPLLPTVQSDMRNMPAAVVEVLGPDGGSLGTWLVSLQIGRNQSFAFQNRAFEMALRPRRYYKPYSVHLLEFKHETYPGTDIPRNFSSLVRVISEGPAGSREALISMNHPLRHGGDTWYQASYEAKNPNVSIFQVVRNPGWITPYVGCILVMAGLFYQFMTHLFRFVKERRQA